MTNPRLERAVAVADEHVDRAWRRVGVVEVAGSGRRHQIEPPVVVQIPGRDVRELRAGDHAPAVRHAAGIDEDVDLQRARDRDVAAPIAVEIAARGVGRLIPAALGEQVDRGLEREVTVPAIELQRVVHLGHQDVAAAVAVEVRDVRPDPDFIDGVVRGTDRPRRREGRAGSPRQHGDRVPLANDDVDEAVGVEVPDTERKGGAPERTSRKERPVAASQPDHQIGGPAGP